MTRFKPSTVVALAAAAAGMTARVHAALPSSVTTLMDESVDPCDDFYQYACGTWLKNTALPSDVQGIGYAESTIDDQNEIVLQEIYTSGVPIIGELWDSCMDVNTMNALGNKPLQDTLNQVQAVRSKTELFTLAGAMSITGPFYIFGYYLAPDTKNVTTNRLFFQPGYLSMPYTFYYTDPDTFSFIEADFRQYISTIMALSGYTPTGSNTSDAAVVDTIVSIEQQLANISDVTSGTYDPGAAYNPFTYRDAVDKYPATFGPFAAGLGLLENTKLTEDSTIILTAPAYHDAIEELMKGLDLDDLKTYLAFIFASNGAQYLGDDFYQAYFDLFVRTLQGVETKSSRSTICSDIEIGYLPDLVGEYFVQKAFDNEREVNIEGMVDLIEKTMQNHIDNVTWLDDTTRAAAQDKLSKVGNLIGHSKQNVTYSFSLNASAYFDNLVAISGDGTFRLFRQINQPVDRNAWSMSAATNNAYNSRQTNQMVFPAGILQPPLFDKSNHPAQNFGGIGVMIGHELTHGFDSAGRRYDSDGNVRNWWTEQTTEAFDERARCFADEYSAFVVVGQNGSMLGNVDGNLTIAENIADNGGLSLAFDAFHSYMQNASNVGVDSDLTDDEADKLFFLSHAQSYCSKVQDATTRQRLENDEHSPDKWRINGAYVNSESFARVYQCAKGSNMNPSAKCELW